MHRLYLSRENLQLLLSKLDSGREQAAILKNDLTNRDYPTSVPTLVVAVEDHLYYAHRRPDPPDMVAKPEPAPDTIPAPESGPLTIVRRRKKG